MGMEKAIVRILRRSGDETIPIGSGCVATSGLILTCAHVVDYAIGRDVPADTAPTESILIDYPFARHLTNSARVISWSGQGGKRGDDLAILKTDTQHPMGVRSPCFGHAAPREPISVLGFPIDSTASGDQPQWANGVSSGVRPDGLMQIEDTDQTGYWVKPGFSGAPVWNGDRNRVVGIVAATEADASRRVGFVAPIEELLPLLSSTLADDTETAQLLESYESNRAPSVERLVRATDEYTLLLSGEVRAVADELELGERLIRIFTAVPAWIPFADIQAGLLAQTDRRLLYVYKLPFVRRVALSFVYQDLKRVHLDMPRGKGLVTLGTLRIESGKRNVTLTLVKPADQVHEMVAYATDQIQFVQDGQESRRRLATFSSIDADIEERVRLALEPFNGVPDFYVAPNIPARKLRNARIAAKVPDEEVAVGLIDCTIFGGAKDALLLTTSGIYYHHSQHDGGRPLYRSYSDLDSASLTSQQSGTVRSLELDDSVAITLVGSGTPAKAVGDAVKAVLAAVLDRP